MKERPINFNGDMVRAILRGQKTQTRRPVNPQPVFIYTQDGWGPLMHIPGRGVWFNAAPSDICPYGVPGDRLLVRAMSNLADPDADNITLEIISVEVARVQGITDSEAIAEGAREINHVGDNSSHLTWSMGDTERYGSPRKAFAAEWDSIYAKRGLGWRANPWVWVIEFKRAEYTHDTIVALCREVKELRELRDAAYRAGYRPPQPIIRG